MYCLVGHIHYILMLNMNISFNLAFSLNITLDSINKIQNSEIYSNRLVENLNQSLTQI